MRANLPQSLRRRVYEVVERIEGRGVASRIFAIGLVSLIVVNVAAAVFDSIPNIGAGERRLLRVIEYVSLVAFALEYALRVWVAVEHPRARGKSALAARLAYMATPEAIIDLLALAPFIVARFFDVNLRVVLLLRLLRLFKLARYSTGFQSLFESVRRERHALFACLLILMSLVLVFAALMYTVERDVQPQTFGSIPDAMWWAIETVTTVGYGDAIPATALGRAIAGICMIGGIIMIALPVAIVATSFAEVIRQKGFVVTYATVARVPMFSGLDEDDISELLPRLRAVTVNAGGLITPEGKTHHALYVIVDGRVELDLHVERRTLASGDAFGGVASLRLTEPGHPTFALSAVRLLVLESMDYARLADRRPGFETRLRLPAAA